MLKNHEEIENRLKSKEKINFDTAFLILQSLCELVNHSYDTNRLQLLLLRILDRKEEFLDFTDVLNGLIRHFGLYPYLDVKTLNFKDELARALHKPSLLSNTETEAPSDDDFVFHRVQAEIFQYILNGKNVILSAPTSFGKSAIIDAIIDSHRFNNIAIVVPTIALIDETRRRLSKFKNSYKIITHASQKYTDKNIFILTQERTVEFSDLLDQDIFILDEFYKLDPNQDSERATTLNHAFYELYKKSKQFYLLGPNIDRIPDGFQERFECKFIRTDFSTVVTELIKIKSNNQNKEEKLLELCRKIKEPTLIYCASPNSARKITKLLSEQCCLNSSLSEAAEWIGEHYHPDWTLVKGLKNGIGMHHGRMPRALAQLCVKGFNDGSLQFLVCTSTLIEGVNTKAKNVIIYDNKIATKKYDFFTFNNIKGRSGRMFQHFIGNVYIFNDPPQQDLPLVDIPVFSQDEDNTKESLIIQLDREYMTDNSWNRIEKYYNQDTLSIPTIKQNIGIEPKDQINLALEMLNDFSMTSNLAWNSLPEYNQLKYLCNLIWKFFVKSGHMGEVVSGEQLALKLSRIRHKSIEDIIQLEIKDGKTADYAVEDTLNFVRQWPQFHFPRYAMAVCRIQNEIAQKQGIDLADYSFYCGQIENLFLDPVFTALDEYGLPLQIAQRIDELKTDGNLDLAIEKLSKLNISNLELTEFEKNLVLEVQKTI